MPLRIAGELVDHQYFSKPSPFVLNHKFKPHLQELANQWTCKERSQLDKDVLYVSQREYAIIDPECRGDVRFIATDSATTCHIMIVIHPETKVIGLTHFDGCSIHQGLTDMMSLMDQRVTTLAGTSLSDTTSRCYDVYMFGGFDDSRQLSNKLSRQILGVASRQAYNMDVKVMCIGPLNTEMKKNTSYPVFYGAGVNLETLEVCRVVCKDHGPLSALKSCRNFVGPKNMVCAYDITTKSMYVEPFDYQPLADADRWLQLPDSYLLQHLSTSPEQEPDDFISHTRESLQWMVDHPNPLQSVFKDNKTYKFTLQDGYWKEDVS